MSECFAATAVCRNEVSLCQTLAFCPAHPYIALMSIDLKHFLIHANFVCALELRKFRPLQHFIPFTHLILDFDLMCFVKLTLGRFVWKWSM